MRSLALTAGIDIGAGTTKSVVMEDGTRVVAKASLRTGPNPEKAGAEALAEVLRVAGLTRADLAYVASTGYGRYQMAGRDMQITEITCHGRGARFLFPATHCVLDIGAQSSRAMRIDGNGRIVKFKMNDRCAAGAGRVLARGGKAPAGGGGRGRGAPDGRPRGERRHGEGLGDPPRAAHQRRAGVIVRRVVWSGGAGPRPSPEADRGRLRSGDTGVVTR